MTEETITKEVLVEIVDTLSGSCEPYGDSRVDEKNFENLKKKEYLIDSLINDIHSASIAKNRHEYSMYKIGIDAYEYLKELKHWLTIILEEEIEN